MGRYILRPTGNLYDIEDDGFGNLIPVESATPATVWTDESDATWSASGGTLVLGLLETYTGSGRIVEARIHIRASALEVGAPTFSTRAVVQPFYDLSVPTILQGGVLDPTGTPADGSIVDFTQEIVLTEFDDVALIAGQLAEPSLIWLIPFGLSGSTDFRVYEVWLEIITRSSPIQRIHPRSDGARIFPAQATNRIAGGYV